MKTRSTILMAIFLLTFIASIAFASAADSSAASVDQTENQAALAVDETEATGVPDNATSNASENASTKSSPPAAPVSVQGIWKVSLAGTDITMALNQSGESIFGRAKFEGDNPWNGAVAGSLSGNSVHLSLAAMQGDVLSSVYLAGTIEGDSMTGSYVRSDSSGKAARGDLTATLISPDTSGYTAATVAPAAEIVPETTASKEESSPPTVNITDSAAQPAATTESKFKDVTQLAKGINPNILPRMAAL